MRFTLLHSTTTTTTYGKEEKCISGWNYFWQNCMINCRHAKRTHHILVTAKKVFGMKTCENSVGKMGLAVDLLGI
jgi:hypothetical protein